MAHHEYKSIDEFTNATVYKNPDTAFSAVGDHARGGDCEMCRILPADIFDSKSHNHMLGWICGTCEKSWHIRLTDFKAFHRDKKYALSK